MDRYGEDLYDLPNDLDYLFTGLTATVLLNGDSPLFNSQTLSNQSNIMDLILTKSGLQLAHYWKESSVLCLQRFSTSSIPMLILGIISVV